MMRLGLQTALHSLRQPRLLTIGTGNGTTTSFTQPPQVTPGTAIYVNDWQGNQLQYNTPRTNIALQSNAFGTTPWGIAAATATQNVTGPDGVSNSGWDLVDSAATNNHGVYQSVNVNANGTYTVSCFAKAGTHPGIAIQRYDSNGYTAWAFNTSTGTNQAIAGTTGGVTNESATMELLANGWYKCSYTFTLGSGITRNFIYIYLLNSAGTAAYYTGDGTGSCYIYGTQVEESSIATSYILTTTSPVTQTDYTLSGGNIVFAVAPAASAAITATV